MAKASKTAKTAKTANVSRMDNANMLNLSISNIEMDLANNRKAGLDQESIQNFAYQLIQDGGVHQPVTVFKKGEKYFLVAGHRRVLASQKAGFTTVPAIVVPAMTEEEAFAINFGENVQRKNLSPIDAAIYFRRAQEKYKWTLKKISQYFFDGADNRMSEISNYMKLLTLHQSLQDAIHNSQMSIKKGLELVGKQEAQGLMAEVAEANKQEEEMSDRQKMEENRKAQEILAKTKPELGLPQKPEKQNKTPNPLEGAMDDKGEKGQRKSTDIPAPPTTERTAKRDEKMSDPQALGLIGSLIGFTPNFPIQKFLIAIRDAMEGKKDALSRGELVEMAKSFEIVKKDAPKK